MTRLVNDEIISKELVEKWLEFYKYQLKRDLLEEHDSILTRIENEDERGQAVKASMSILDTNGGMTQNADTDQNGLSLFGMSRKNLKSKTLFDSIRMLILVMNKTGRILNESSPPVSSVIITFFKLNRIDLYFMDFIGQHKSKREISRSNEYETIQTRLGL